MRLALAVISIALFAVDCTCGASPEIPDSGNESPDAAGCTGSQCPDASSNADASAGNDSGIDSGPGTDAGPRPDGGIQPDASVLADAGCQNAAGCTAVGINCADSTHTVNCVAAPNGCLVASGLTACPDGQSCQGAAGSAACACPAPGPANSGTPTGCATAGDTACDATSGNIDTCATVGSCLEWQADAAGVCVSQGLVCTTQGGNAVCDCPPQPAGATTVYVDSANGSDQPNGTVTPTGVQNPPECRFGTITFSLTQVPANGSVIATGPTPMTFDSQGGGGTNNTETYPLNVPANVMLTTTDTTPTPANFIIVFDDANPGSAMVLGAGSTVRGFTVQNSGGKPSAVELVCTSGIVTLDTVVLNATGRGTTLTGGALAASTCGLAATNLTASGFSAAGIGLASTASSTLSGGTIDANSQAGNLNTVGIAITNGIVTATATVVTGSSGSGIAVTGGSLSGTKLSVTGCQNLGVALIPANAGASITLTDGAVTGNGLNGSSNSAGVGMTGGNLILNGTAVNSNGASGLGIAGGTAVLGTDSAGIGTTIDGNGTLTATSAGIGITGGTLTATGIDVSGNKASGLAIVPGTAAAATVTVVIMGSTIGNNASGAAFGGNGGDGVFVDSQSSQSSVTLEGVLIANNGARGVELVTAPGGVSNAATVTIDGTKGNNGTLITGNGTTTNDANVRAGSGVLVVTGSGSAPVTVSAAVNGYGFNLVGATTTLTGVTVSGNALSGIHIDDGNSSFVTVSNGTISGNGTAAGGGDGVTVVRAPVTTGGAPIQLDGVTVQSNKSAGINLNATAANIGVVVANCRVTGNGSTGIIATEGQVPVHTIQASFTGNTVEANFVGATTSGAAGGFLFQLATGTAQTLLNNVVGGNGGDQIVILGGGAWTLNGSAGNCATANQIFCYKAPYVGLRFSATGIAGATVDASNNSWKNSPPTLLTDFGYGGATATGITALPACSAVTTCP